MKANEMPEKYKTCDWLWNYGSIGLTKEHIKSTAAGYEWDAEKKELKKIKQVSNWNEEDEKFFQTALYHISNSISNGKSSNIICSTTDWLKFIKERIKIDKKS